MLQFDAPCLAPVWLPGGDYLWLVYPMTSGASNAACRSGLPVRATRAFGMSSQPYPGPSYAIFSEGDHFAPIAPEIRELAGEGVGAARFFPFPGGRVCAEVATTVIERMGCKGVGQSSDEMGISEIADAYECAG